LRSVRAVLAGSLVFGSVVMAWVIGDAVPASATAPSIVKCNAGGNLQTAINAASEGSTLIVHGTCTGNFTIAESLTLQGSGTLSGTGHDGPVLTINSGTAFLNNLTIENGNDTSSVGGGIFNSGVLTLRNSTVSDNTAIYGGGIWNQGTLTVTNSTVSGNTASVVGGGGGGILSYSGTSAITNSTVSGNTASVNGGGIYNYSSALTVTRSLVSDNGAPNGGGIFNYNQAPGTLTLINSSINKNTATEGGGGIYNLGTVTQPSTDKGGVSINGNTSGGNGGGFDNEGGTVTLPNAAVIRNSAVNGGGVYNDGGSAFSANNTSVNHNTATRDGGGIYNNGRLSLSPSVSVNFNTAASGGGIYTTVVLSPPVPAGDVAHNIPDNIVVV
jgi:predicted outer membrane repeat protein